MGEPNFKWQVHASGLSLKIKNHGCHAIKDKTDKKTCLLCYQRYKKIKAMAVVLSKRLKKANLMVGVR